MKKVVLCTLLSLMSMTVCFAQSKYEYCDVYARGSWYNMKITVMQKNKSTNLQGNIGNILNKMAEQGWELNESIVIPRHGIPFTRHKLHFIMRRVISDKTPIQGTEPIAKSSISSNNTSSVLDTTLMNEFNSGEIANLDKFTINAKVEEFINEISSDLKVATSKEDMLIIDKKIKALDAYNKNLPKKDFSIIDELSIFKSDFKRKVKKLGLAIS